MSELNKVASAINKQLHDEAVTKLLDKIASYTPEDQTTIREAILLVKQAEARGELSPQTAFSRLNLAHELAVAAAIEGDENFHKMAAQSYAAGELAGRLLTEYVEANSTNDG